MRPLFITSFLLADFLEDNSFFGARRVVISSGSSKTAYGTAWCLKDDPRVELVALTSPSNRIFVEQLGVYAKVLAYDEFEKLDATVPTTYVDFSGDEKLRARIHRHLRDALVYDCAVGSAQNAGFVRETGLPGAAPKFFFAPKQVQKRTAEWGFAEFNRKFGEAQAAFIRRVTEAASPLLRVIEHRGIEAAPALVGELASGRGDPSEGHVLVF